MASSPRVRMRPDTRREQLLDLGVRLLSSRSLDDLSIETLAEEAGVSRGLLYHYFGNKQDFHRAVVRRAADRLIAVTAPEPQGDGFQRLSQSLAAYVDYVVDNHEGYVSLVRGAAAGDPQVREIYEEARQALIDRIFTDAEPEHLAAFGIEDTPAVRLLVRGWSSFLEEVVVSWVRDPAGVSREQVVHAMAAALPGVLAGRPRI